MKIIRVRKDLKMGMPIGTDGGWCIKKPKKDGFLVSMDASEAACGAVFISDEELEAAKENLNH
jgi:hypothetical protein